MSSKKQNKTGGFATRNKFLVNFSATILFFIIVFSLVVSIIYIIPFFQDYSSHFTSNNIPSFTKDDNLKIAQNIAETEKNIKKIQQKIFGKTPNVAYMVVNTSANHFFLYKNKKLIREGLCSTGSYILLQAEDQQKWIFKTPRGEFRIRGKTTSPVWIRPDWSFIEEGLPIPKANDDSRYEYGVLGDYALSLGYGYMIHGTLYKRFLGMPVTHGCIRLGDDDLKIVYTNLDIGSKVFIF
jgi:hypothetical protein